MKGGRATPRSLRFEHGSQQLAQRLPYVGVRLWVIGDGHSSFNTRIAVSESLRGLTVDDLAVGRLFELAKKCRLCPGQFHRSS